MIDQFGLSTRNIVINDPATYLDGLIKRDLSSCPIHLSGADLISLCRIVLHTLWVDALTSVGFSRPMSETINLEMPSHAGKSSRICCQSLRQQLCD